MTSEQFHCLVHAFVGYAFQYFHDFIRSFTEEI